MLDDEVIALLTNYWRKYFTFCLQDCYFWAFFFVTSPQQVELKIVGYTINEVRMQRFVLYGSLMAVVV